MADLVEINPEILEWARKRAGLSLLDAARRLKVTEGQLEDLEHGRITPSRSLLKRIATIYRRPLVTFYMASPPKAGLPVGDFRTLMTPPPPEERALLEALVRDIRARQSIARDLLEGDEDVRELPFIGKFRPNAGIQVVADDIRRTLRVTYRDQQDASSADDLFKLLRTKTESAGVFALLIGDLGSAQHNSISVETFRGYALVDKIAPFVVVNDRDAKAAYSFTLLHELAHLWVGAEGISGPAEAAPHEHLSPIEVFCNAVASEFLLPAAALPSIDSKGDDNADYVHSLVEQTAAAWNLSRSAVVYRFYKNKMISNEVWSGLSSRYAEEWKRSREQEKERNAQRDGGPDYYVVRRDRIGSALLNLARRSIGEGTLSYTRAAKLLAVKASNVAPLLAKGL